MDIQRISKESRKYARQRRRERGKNREQALHEAWICRHFYEARKLPRIIACTCCGLRGRKFARVARAATSADVWVQRMQQPGTRGGCSAVLVTEAQTQARCAGFRQHCTAVVGDEEGAAAAGAE